MVLLLKEYTPVHHERLSLLFCSGNSSFHWFSKACQTPAVKEREVGKLVLMEVGESLLKQVDS